MGAFPFPPCVRDSLPHSSSSSGSPGRALGALGRAPGQQRQRGVFKCPPRPSRLGAKWRSSCLFTVGGCKLAFGESRTAHFPAARLGRERGGDLQLRKTTRKASICHFLGGNHSEESCLSLLTDAGSCGEMVAHWFTSNSLFPSLIPSPSVQTQTQNSLPATFHGVVSGRGFYFPNGRHEAGFAVNEKNRVHLHGCIITLYRDLSDSGEHRERERKVGRHERELKARSLDEIKE